MNTHTGEIVDLEKLVEQYGKEENIPDYFKPINFPLTTIQKNTGSIGKYDPCPCGSGKKFKFCCWRK